MANKPKPNGKCYCCGSQKWWWNEKAQNWNCGVCHPDPNPEPHVLPDDPGQSPSAGAPNLKVDPGPFAVPSEAQVGEAGEPAQPQEKLVTFEKTAENMALLTRVRNGNLKLIKAWPQIIRNPSDADFAKLSLEFYQAKAKLEGLCQELQARGYHDCLYLENGVKTQRCDGWPNSQMCKVCPSEIDYFAAELFGGEPPVRRHLPQREKQGEVIMEFLKTLGGKI